MKFSGIGPGGLGSLHFKDSRFIIQTVLPQLSLTLTQLMKKAWTNLMTSKVTRRLMGIKLLKRMMKVRKFRPKLAAPPSGKRRARGGRGETGSKLTESFLSYERHDGVDWGEMMEGQCHKLIWSNLQRFHNAPLALCERCANTIQLFHPISPVSL